MRQQVPCEYAAEGLCCMDDPDDPCWQPVMGPLRRPIKIRYSARFTQQVRTLSGDRRWPLRPAAPTEAATSEEGRCACPHGTESNLVCPVHIAPTEEPQA